MRQTGLGGANSAGSGRSTRLDPLALPVRFTAADAAADGRVRQIEINRERVRLDRRVRGMAIRVNMPLDAYLGISVRLLSANDNTTEIVAVRLEHRDPALTIELYCGPENADAVNEWQLWARELCVPMLVADRLGRLHRPAPLPGEDQTRPAAPRRRRRNAVKSRRPSLPLRRKAGDATREMAVHLGEREIIARN